MSKTRQTPPDEAESQGGQAGPAEPTSDILGQVPAGASQDSWEAEDPFEERGIGPS